MLIADTFLELREKQLPDVVYHYTSPAGLCGILTKKAVWATDTRYLTDSSELEYARLLCTPVLQSRHDNAAAGSPERALFQQLLHYLTDVAPTIRVYVASFSARGNLLSQWRAYCPTTGGFSLGITSRVLEQRSGYQLVPCVYSATDQGRFYKNLLDRTLQSFQDSTPAGEQEPERVIRMVGIGLEFLSAFLMISSAFKHNSFQEEEEWRVIGKDATPPLFRIGLSGLVPYLELPLVADTVPLRIDQIVVGPNPHAELAKQAVESLLEVLGVLHDGVDLCGIPYRSW